jgi:hypothetical protein
MWLLACASPDGGTATQPEDTAPADTGATDTGPPAPLELCINEFMPSNQASIQDETLAWPDWIELHNPTDAPVTLGGWAVGDGDEADRAFVLPDGLAIPPGGFQLLWADGLPDLGPAHLGFSLASDGGAVSLFAPDRRGSVVRYGAIPDDFSVARTTDCCREDGCFDFPFRGTPGYTNVVVTYEDVSLLALGSTWRYLDGGVAPPADWMMPSFDDSAWASGPAPLGYGDDQTTIVGYGADAANKYVATWFRTGFSVGDPSSFVSLTLHLVRDDGAVVYLNGVEVARSNMPDGTIAADTLAATSISGASEAAEWTYTLDPTALVHGIDVLAVEVHQASVDSSDIRLDAELVGSRPTTR